MKRIALLAVVGGSLLALPSTAAAQSGDVNCPGGVGASADQICINVGGLGGELVIANADSCTYINGWSTNAPAPTGYAGLCTGAQSEGPGCDASPDGNPPNTGGCFGIKGQDDVNEVLNTGAVGAVTAMFICGNTSGEDPQGPTPPEPGRDGCLIP